MIADAEETALVVTRATRWIGLIMLTTLLAGSVTAEDLPFPDSDALEMPYDSSTPSALDGVPLPDAENLPAEPTSPRDMPSRLVSPPRQLADENSSLAVPDSHVPTADGIYDESMEGALAGDSYYGGWDADPAPIESSGTWLNRGVWYFETDGVILYRVWQRAATFVAADDPNVTIANSLPAVGLLLNTNRVLRIPSDHPGGDAGVRAKLGRFLFRDDHNRDHTMELTAWSAGNWTSDNQVSSADPNGLFVSFNLAGANDFFDGSTTQRLIYDSRLNDFELNYRLKRRLGRDQLVMDPNGNWRREASNGFNRDFLAGFRYVQLDETLNWTAQDILVTGANGKYQIDTTNDLFGFQMGGGIEYESGRWSAGLNAKAGLYWNNANAHQQLNLTADDANDFNRDASQSEISWIGESEIITRYHITPNASLRAGLEVMVLDSLALAPRQINFINNSNWIETGGNPWYMGGFLGVECYW